jgi:hypothetical protein
MILKKQTEAWFDFDDARILIRELSPGDKMKLGDESISKRLEYRMTDEKREPVRVIEPKPAREREAIITMAVRDWENVNDESGVAIECNNEGKIAILNGVPGFYEFVLKSLETLTADSEKAQEVAEKN